MGILRALVERFGKRGAAEIVEQAERIRPPVREIGAGGMPIAQAQPYRNSLRGGSDDLMEAARSRTPESAWEEFGSLQGGTPEARLRAQEQGYTGPWYRGLSQPYDDAQANPAFYVNDPRYASDFATGQDGANVVPVMLRTRGARQVPYADIEGQYDGMWNGSVGDGVVVSQEPSNSGRMLAVARPGGDIRSIFAAFDPAKRDRSDLLAGLALGAPLGGGLLSHAQRRRERARA